MVTSIVSTALLGVDRYRKLRASRHLRQVEHPAVGDLDPAAKEALVLEFDDRLLEVLLRDIDRKAGLRRAPNS
jgi:hypothetical protein